MPVDPGERELLAQLLGVTVVRLDVDGAVEEECFVQAVQLVLYRLGCLRAVDVTLPVITAQTMAQDLERSQAAPKVVATCLGVLGGLALVLASIGLYAVVAFAVARRSREIGIRMALGARSQQVVSSINRGVAGLIGVATSIGLFLTVLIVLALRATPGSADIGIGSMDVYRPNIDRWRLWPSRPLRQWSASPHSCPRAGPSEWIHLWPCATGDATLPAWSTTSGLP